LDVLDENGVAEAKVAVSDGLLSQWAFDAGRAVLTDEGRLLADGIVRRLLP
jgi:hypothetical protein